MQDKTRRTVLAGVGGTAALLGGSGTVFAAEHDDEPNDDYDDDEPAERAPDGAACVRAVHASPDAPPVDVYVNGMPLLSDVPFRAISGYLVLLAGTYRVQVVPAGADPAEAAIDAEVSVDDAKYTVAAIGEVGEGAEQPIDALVMEDDTSPVGDGQARVRFVHASPDAPPVDIVPAGAEEPLFANVSFGEFEYAEVPGGTYTLEVRPAGEEDVVGEFPVTLVEGWIYSGFAMGYLAPGEAATDEPLNLELSIDAATPAGGPMPDPEEERDDEPDEPDDEPDEPDDEPDEPDDEPDEPDDDPEDDDYPDDDDDPEVDDDYPDDDDDGVED